MSSQGKQPEIWHHQESIVCPKCQSVETATVEHTAPFWTYTHSCSKCGYLIMESEWDQLEENNERN
jgi:C4-type Zn-finger protein